MNTERENARKRAREKLALAEQQRGRLYAAIIRGEACCHVNDPDYSKKWWEGAMDELNRLMAAAR